LNHTNRNAAETPAPSPRPATWSRPVAVLDRIVSFLDEVFDRLYSSRLNPLHQSGTLAILSFLVLIFTGLYLFLFYSVDQPYESVLRIENEVLGGSWVRTVHTHAADLAMISILLHAVKMFLAGRSWGPRVRAWITGVVLVGITLLCGWTGQVMAWDLQGQVVAVELTKLMDLLPVFSMPMGRAFSGLEPVPGSFYFMNLFLHVCLPLGLAFVLWLHLAHLTRPRLLPPRALSWSAIALLALIGATVSVPLATRADLLAIPKNVPVDLVYNFWLPVAWYGGPGIHAAAWAGTAALFLSVPWWWRKKRTKLAPSWVDPDLCTGCTTCYKDCPFDAISMVERPDPGRKSSLVAVVNPARCVSCGICAGSCAPMGVGPPLHTGRRQLGREQQRIAAEEYPPGHIIVFACRHGGMADDPRLAAMSSVTTRTIECAGNLHTSVIELVLKAGAAGAFVLTCAARSAPCREGPKWLHERVYNDREAELPARVDKRRVAIAGLSRGEWPAIAAELESFRDRLGALQPASREADLTVGVECEPKEVVDRA
jgi:ferredoxin